MGETPLIVPLLASASGAFGAGLLGSIWYTKKKQNQRIETERKEGIRHLPLRTRPRKLTPAEYAVVQREARFFAFKTLGLGTLLTLTGMATVSWWFDVHSFKDVSGQLKVIVPRKTSQLREILGAKKFEMTEEEELEWNSLDIEE
ncbi:unnamed protein product [Rhizopus stolonifer]